MIVRSDFNRIQIPKTFERTYLPVTAKILFDVRKRIGAFNLAVLTCKT